jgi:hypothetical protein
MKIRRMLSVLAAMSLVVGVVGLVGSADPIGASTTATSVAYTTVCPVAGSGQPTLPTLTDGVPALAAQLRLPAVLAADDAGNVYFYSTASRRIQKRDAITGLISTIVGAGTLFPNDGGNAIDTRLGDVLSMAIDPGGSSLFFVEGGYVARKIDLATGLISTLAGIWLQSGSASSGVAATTPIGDLHGIAVSGSKLYLSQLYRGRLLEVDLTTGLFTTVVGGGLTSPTGPLVITTGVPGTDILLEQGWDVAADGLGRVYVMSLYKSILRYDPATGIARNVGGADINVVGLGVFDDSDGGPAANERFGSTATMAGTADGLVIGSSTGNRIKVLGNDGNVTVLAGSRVAGFADGVGAAARFGMIRDVATDSTGRIYVADATNNRIRLVTPAGAVSTLVGVGPSVAPTSYAGVKALDLPLQQISGVASGRIGGSVATFVADAAANRILKIDDRGVVSVLAGDGGNRGFTETLPDGTPALSYRFGANVYDIASVANLQYDGTRYLYAAEGGDSAWYQLVRIDLSVPTAPVTKVTAAGAAAFAAGGVASSSTLLFTDYDVAPNGDIYLTARSEGRVYRINAATGLIDVFAGDGSLDAGTLVGVGGPAIAAKIGVPLGVSVRANGSVYISAQPGAGGSVLLRVDADGILRHIAGTGNNSDLTEGPALSAHLAYDDLVVDQAGTVFMSGAGSAHIAKYDPVAGTVSYVLQPGTSSDPGHVAGGTAVPVAAAATSAIPQIALSPSGNLLFTDSNLLFGSILGPSGPYDAQFRVRMLTRGGCAEPTAGVAPTSATLFGSNVPIDTAAIPAANIPASAIFAAASSTIASIDLSSTAPIASPLRSIPLRSIPLRSIGFPPILLSTVPRNDGQSWETVLAGTPLDGVPAQHITLQQVLDLADLRAADGVSPRYLLLNGLTLASIDLAASPLRSISLASIALGTTPLRSIVFTAAPDPGAFATYCNAAAVAGGYACTGAAGDAPLVAAELAGIPLRSIPLRSIPLRSIDLSSSPLRSIPLRSIDLSVSPLRSIPLRSILIAGSPLRSIPLRSIPLRSIDVAASPLRSIPLRSIAGATALFNCALVNCSAATTNTDTLQTAADASAIPATTTAGQLLDALDNATADAFVLGDLKVYVDGANKDISIGDIQPFVPTTLTLADVLIALIPRSELPWEDISLDDLRLSQLGAGARLTLEGQYTVYDNRPSGSTALLITLPPGVAVVSAQPALPAPAVASSEITVLADGRWRVPVPTTASGLQSYSISVGLTKRSPVSYSIEVVDEITGGQAGVVVQSNAVAIPEGTRTGEPTLADGTITMGWLSGTPGEVDSYQVPVPSVPGAVTTVTLSHLGADGDLIGYNPTVRPPVSSRGFRPAGLQSPPAESTDPELAPAVPAIDPQTVQDLPIDPAAANGVASVSAQRGSTTEKVEFVTKPGDAGFYRVSVAGYNGAASDEPYLVTVRQQIPAGSGVCPARPAPTAAPGAATPSIPSDRRTVFVINEQRLRSQYPAAAVNSMLAKLTTLANRVEVAGTIVRVDSNASVRAAYTAWDGAPCDAQRANDVVGAINTYVDTLLAAATPKAQLASIVIVGSDEMIPMARLSDNTKVENEAAYAGEVRAVGGAATPLSSSLSARNLLTDDAYGDFDPIRWRDTALYIPDVALGRLVETPAEMERSIDPYLANQRLAASTALVAGYDFLIDGSVAVDTALGSVIPAASRTTQINNTWTRANIEAALYPAGASPYVVALNAHFDHYKALPAAGNTTNDQSDMLTTQAVISQPNRLQGRLVFSIGCHSGLNVPDGYLGVGAGARAKDWAQVLVNDGAVYIGNTGYGYGDRATVAFSERLQYLFAQRLDGRYSVGAALTSAKQEYFATLGAYSDYDHKAMMELTFYGLPFFGYGPNNGAPILPPKLSTAPDPSTGGLAAADTSFTPVFQTNTTSDGETFLTADAQTPQVVEGFPIEPRVDRDVSPTNTALVAHGALITALTSVDSANTDAAFARPVVDLAANEPSKPVADVAFPSKLQNVASYTAPDGSRQRLTIIPGQFVGEPSTPGVGLQRRFTSVTAKVLYAPATSTDYTAPTFRSVSAAANGSAVNIATEVSDSGGSIVRVLALYRDGAVWRSADLTKLSSSGGVDKWVGNGPATNTVIDIFVQAVDSSGNVAVTSDKATLFQAAGSTQNFAPTVNAGPDITATPGAAVTIAGRIVDPDSSSWTGTITSGAPGSTPQPLTITGTTFAPTLTYSATGTYTVTIQICDNGNRCSSDTAIVTISATAPPLTVSADMGVNGLQTVGFQPVRITGGLSAQLAVITGSFANAPSGARIVTVRWTPTGAFVPVLRVNGTTFAAANVYPSVGTNVATVKVCVGTVCATDDVTIVTGVSSTALSPVLECVVDRGAVANPRYQARFGSNSTATVPVYQPTLTNLTNTVFPGVTIPPAVNVALQLLSDNKFNPLPAYRGQTQVFAVGRQVNSFQVDFNSGNQVWSLNGRTATASSNSARCP